MLVAKLIAEKYQRPNERDLREASELLDEPVKMKLGYDDEIYYIVAAIVSKSGDIVRLKDVDGKLL